jgi:hypothetical protein
VNEGRILKCLDIRWGRDALDDQEIDDVKSN